MLLKKRRGKYPIEKSLDRILTVRLIVHEARNMGLDQLPEAKAMIQANTQEYLRKTLLDHVLENVKPDEKEVEAYYS